MTRPHRRSGLPFAICVVPLVVTAGPSACRASAEIFTDVTKDAGIDWQHFSGKSEDRHLIESTCGGVGFLDYDNDGNLDIFLVNGGETPNGRSERPVRHALYRNLGDNQFEDVAASAGMADLAFFGMGAAVADFNNDGLDDIFVTGFPRCALLRNDGEGRFVDVADTSGTRNHGEWSASAAWFDYDLDGYLDLFVTNYATLPMRDPPRCEYAGQAVYCAQTAYSGRLPRLYRNNGDETFADVTERAGLSEHEGRALGVVTIDVDDDGWQDVFVARDASPNLLLMNRGDGTFRDRALEAEVAYSPHGVARAGMGIDAGDVNGDGNPDFVVTNFDSEFHALYSNPGGFPFEEVTRSSGLGRYTRPFVGWGARFLDYDSDGDLDLVTANGHINHMIERTRHDVSFLQPPLLLENVGGPSFRDRRVEAGRPFRNPALYRGLAVGDIDNDGDPDVVITRLGDRPVLLRNNGVGDIRWIGLELEGTHSNRDAIGARVTLRADPERVIVRWVKGGASFLASHDRRVLLGLGPRPGPDRVSVEIEWPNGLSQLLDGLAVGRYHKIREPEPSE